MLEILNTIDTRLFIFFNITLANPLFDLIMPAITNKYNWFPVWGILIVGLIWKGGERGRWVVLLALIVVTLSDQTAASLMKPFFQRIRPCNVVEGVHLLLNKKSSYSMPSAHAANFFAVASLFAYYYRRYHWYYWTIAVLVAYSRIAVGVHYPFDILVGGMIGTFLAGIVILLFSYLYQLKTHRYLKIYR